MQAVLYYDGKCPLCAKEMRHLRRLKSDSLNLVDIHALELDAEIKQERLQVLHLELENGEFVTGVDASVRAWRYTRVGWLLAPLRWAIFKPVVDWVYAKWAQRRYDKLYGCKTGVCEPRA
jgi:predicted DCC family thiol-disulfide oxidoreductase YuxK